jgi:hypothetical protein
VGSAPQSIQPTVTVRVTNESSRRLRGRAGKQPLKRPRSTRNKGRSANGTATVTHVNISAQNREHDAGNAHAAHASGATSSDDLDEVIEMGLSAWKSHWDDTATANGESEAFSCFIYACLCWYLPLMFDENSTVPCVSCAPLFLV